MSEDLVFYTNPMSRGRVVRWMLEEIGQPYRTELMDFAKIKAADYLAVNPMGKVPAIAHNGKVVTEVCAICTYLADAFPAAGLAPALEDRAAYYRWLFYIAGPLEAAVTDKVLGVQISDEQKRMVGYSCFDQMVDVLEGGVMAAGYVAGDRFTTADLLLAAYLGFYMVQFGVIEKRAAFEAYVARMTERPAYKRAAEIDDGLIARAQQQQPA
ncbi:MAG: glutathione S-transferase family protein [Sphingomonadaceae bacterium]|nr:glutathione S-transferase family protein [Sphingomonadaceae bacterium]